MRPLLRSRVMARREAPVREEGANQRWYRVFDALCPKGQGVFFAYWEDGGIPPRQAARAVEAVWTVHKKERKENDQ